MAAGPNPPLRGAAAPKDPSGLGLLVEPPSGECLQVPVARNPFVLGRLSECELTLRDSRISRRHARIRFKDGVYSIEDLGSRHGLTVNGEWVERCDLAVGDRIGFGVDDSFEVTVVEGYAASAPLLKKVSALAVDPGRTGALGRLAAMLDVARTMTASEGVEEVFEAVVEAALTITSADRAFLLLRDGDGDGELNVMAACDPDGAIDGPQVLEVSGQAIAEALERRSDLFAMPVEFGGGASGPRNALCVPILRMRLGHDHETTVISTTRSTLGGLYMDARDPGVRLVDGNQALLQALAIEISTVIENARLIEEERAKRRLEQELSLARGIQRALRPAALPAAGWLVAKGHSESSAQLGGDYYDLMQVGPGRWAAVVADVSGKGVAASILASLLQGAFFLGSGPTLSLSGTLGRINRYLCERSSGHARFVTVFASTIDESGEVTWSNAGHCSAILARDAGAVELLEANCRPVGLFEDAEFAEDTCRLRPGDKLVIYSDGVTEARNPAGEQFGEKRLHAAAAALAGRGADEFFQQLLAAIRDFAGGARRADDLTLLVLGYEGR